MVSYMTSRRGTLASLLLLAMLSGVTLAQEADSASGSAEGEPAVADKKEKDPDRGRFLALPIIITEPAIGEGLGAAILYYHGKKKIDQPSITTAGDVGKEDRKNKPPATVTGLFAFATNNETAGVGIGHRRELSKTISTGSRACLHARISIQRFLSVISHSLSQWKEISFLQI